MIMKKYVYADKFFYPTKEVGPGYLDITDGVFGDFTADKPMDAEVIDYTGYYVAAGLVDTHIHGYAGYDVMDNDFAGIEEMSQHLLECGVTSFLPTTLTASVEKLNAVCQTIGDNAGRETGAKIRGIFLEGPFFNEKYKGAQNPAYMSDPSSEKLKMWHQLSNGLVNKIAIAPEREGSVDFIKEATQQGVRVAIAHTDATFDDCQQAVEAGANIFVHVYNGMRGLHHREPGVVGAALLLSDVHDELICDGHHVHPMAAKLVMDCNGRDNTVLVTDCMVAGGQPDGDHYHLGELEVVVKDGTARLKDNGSLAGSLLRLYEGVKNVVDWGIATPLEAFNMASYNAAKSVGIESVCGSLQEGLDADFIVVNPNLEIEKTYLNGQERYSRI